MVWKRVEIRAPASDTHLLFCVTVLLCFMWPVVVCGEMLNRTTNGPDTQPDDIKTQWASSCSFCFSVCSFSSIFFSPRFFNSTSQSLLPLYLLHFKNTLFKSVRILHCIVLTVGIRNNQCPEMHHRNKIHVI